MRLVVGRRDREPQAIEDLEDEELDEDFFATPLLPEERPPRVFLKTCDGRTLAHFQSADADAEPLDVRTRVIGARSLLTWLSEFTLCSQPAARTKRTPTSRTS